MDMMAILHGYTEQHQRFLREQETTPVDPAIQRSVKMSNDETRNEADDQ